MSLALFAAAVLVAVYFEEYERQAELIVSLVVLLSVMAFLFTTGAY